MDPISLLIAVAVICLIFWLIFKFMPAQFKTAAYIIVAVLLLIWVVGGLPIAAFHRPLFR